MTIRDIDHGAKGLLKAVEKRPVVKIGVIGSKAAGAKSIRGGGTSQDTVLDIAIRHEFGIGVHKRSFIAGWADESEPDARRRLRKAAVRIVKGADATRELNLFGFWGVGQIQKRISRRIPPGLAESTVRRKGSDVPLIDTGQLRSSITYKAES